MSELLVTLRDEFDNEVQGSNYVLKVSITSEVCYCAMFSTRAGFLKTTIYDLQSSIRGHCLAVCCTSQRFATRAMVWPQCDLAGRARDILHDTYEFIGNSTQCLILGSHSCRCPRYRGFHCLQCKVFGIQCGTASLSHRLCHEQFLCNCDLVSSERSSIGEYNIRMEVCNANPTGCSELDSECPPTQCIGEVPAVSLAHPIKLIFWPTARPVVTSVSPPSGSIHGGTLVSLSGDNFFPAHEIR